MREQGKPFAVLISAYNEASTIGGIVRQCLEFTQHVFVVDDGSSDETAAEVVKNNATLLSNETNLGLGASLQRGFYCLAESGFQNIVVLDGDGAHDPRCIPHLAQQHVRSGVDLTIGSRFLDSNLSSNIPGPKTAANRFATRLVNLVLGCFLTDVASGMRVISRSLFSQSFAHDDFSIAYEIISVALRLGFEIGELPITVRYDPEILFCTKQFELCNLLSFADSRLAANSLVQAPVRQLLDRVENFRKVGVSIDNAAFVLHPIREYRSFIFQEVLTAEASFGIEWVRLYS